MRIHSADSAFSSSTLVEILSHRANQHPDRQAFSFLIDGEREGAHLTYGDLDLKARALGTVLQRQFAHGSRALLVYPSDLEFIVAFFGCLYAGLIAVPTYPPQTRTRRNLDKVAAIVRDVRPAVALTISSLAPLVADVFAQLEDAPVVPLLSTDTVAAHEAEGWTDPSVNGDTLAFLQYTSGSTGTPRGAMITHANVMHNAATIYRHLEVTPETRGLSWLPLYHDMGLIGMVLASLYAGVQTALMPPVAFLQRPSRWLHAIAASGATISGGPNFAYDLCVRRVTPEQKAGLDLSKWQVAVNGAELVRPETIERFATAFASCGFRREAFLPCYGLAEATLLVAGGQVGKEPSMRTVERAALERNEVVTAGMVPSGTEKDWHTYASCGTEVEGQRVVVVDPATRLQCAPGRVGEIWVAGPSVARGYWERPEETARIFSAFLADNGDGPFLRTGDLGFLDDGELFLVDRLKDLIIIRGRNLHPRDIEVTVEESHPVLRTGACAALSVDVEDEERLVIVHELERQHRHANVDEVATAVRRAVAEHHDVEVHAIVLIKPGSMPRTSSGKLQRSACRRAFLEGRLDRLGEWVRSPDEELSPARESVSEAGSSAGVTVTPDAPVVGNGRHLREEVLLAPPAARAGIIERVLLEQLAIALQVPRARLDRAQPLTGLGLDSLRLMELKNWAESDLRVELPITLFTEEISIAQFADRLLAALQAAAPAPSLGRQARHENGTTFDGISGQEAERLLAHLDQLSDAEVDQLLSRIAASEANP